MAVNDVECEDQRDAKARLFDRHTLDLTGQLRTEQSIDGTDLTVAKSGHVVSRHPGAGNRHMGGYQGHLADLFLERHLADELCNTGRRCGFCHTNFCPIRASVTATPNFLRITRV